MNHSNPIFSAHEILQYCHLDIRPDLVHNIRCTVIYILHTVNMWGHSGTVVEVLCYKSEDCQFDPR